MCECMCECVYECVSVWGGAGGLLHKAYLKCFLSGVASTGKGLTQHVVIVCRENGYSV